MDKNKKAKAAYWSGTETSGLEIVRWLDKWGIPYLWDHGQETIYLDGTVAHLRPNTWVLFYPAEDGFYIGDFRILTDAEFKAMGR